MSSFLKSKLYWICSFLLLFCVVISTFSQQQNNSQNVITLGVFVQDKSGNPVPSLHKEDFLLFNGDTPVPLHSFAAKDVPISYGVIIDNTGSMRGRIKDTVQIAKAIVNNHQPMDEAFIVSLVYGEVKGVVEWTTDKNRLLSGIEAINQSYGQISLTKSLNFCAEYLIKHEQSRQGEYRRRALIFISDGLEVNIDGKEEQLSKLFHEKGIQIFAISLYQPPEDTGIPFGTTTRTEKVKEFFKKLEKESEGAVFFPKSVNEFIKEADRVLSYQRSQYILQYISNPNQDKSSTVRLRVKLAEPYNKKSYSVITRFLPLGEESKK